MSWPRSLLFDTHAAIWLMDGSLDEEVVEKIIYAGLADGVFVSPVTAWEIGLLANPRKGRQAVQFLPDPLSWFGALMAKPVIRSAPFTPDIAIKSSMLPGDFHGDPADRFLVATAREMDLTLLTRDRQILSYGEAGEVKTERC
ncbi:MAG TPA: type II toxin-antitoxin system VapC family toxin [Allosphingosinicella sp.]